MVRDHMEKEKKRGLDGCWESYKIKQPIPTALTLSLFCPLLLLSSPAHLNKLTPRPPPQRHHHMSRFTTFSSFLISPPLMDKQLWRRKIQKYLPVFWVFFFFRFSHRLTFPHSLSLVHTGNTQPWSHSSSYLVFRTRVPKYIITIFSWCRLAPTNTHAH